MTFFMALAITRIENRSMVDVKQAVQIAKAKAIEVLEKNFSNLEEIERDVYKGFDVWSITLSVPRDVDQLPVMARLSADPLQYKRFLIDTETGELRAIQLRETASR